MPKLANRTALTRKSQITLPKKVREVLRVKPGDQVTFKIKEGKVEIIPLPSLLEANFGKVQPARKPEDFKGVRKDFEAKVGEEALREF